MQRGLPHCRSRPPASSSIAVRATSAAGSSAASARPACVPRAGEAGGRGGSARRSPSAAGRDPVAAAANSAADGLAQAVQAERGIERRPPRGRGDRGSCWRGRGRPRQSSSVTASPTRMRPGSSTARVERHRAVELAHDAAQHAVILLERVGVERRHHAARPQLHELDERGADADRPAHPLPLREARDAADHDVRPQPPVIDAERADGAVGEDRERQDVEALRRPS